MSAALHALEIRKMLANTTHCHLRSRLDQLPQSSSGRVRRPSVYCGFDPTADSFHLGNLIQILALRRFQECGWRPIVLFGGATGRIGDPSGKQSERPFMDESTVERNLKRLRMQVQPFLDITTTTMTTTPSDAASASSLVLNNYEWHRHLTAMDLLRQVGRHFRVNAMLTKDSVQRRLDSEQGMSFLEFSYPLFQAYDFLHLFKTEQCVLQIGGSDQWGNITAGCDLVRKSEGKEVFGATIPLLTTASGQKFGKSEGNAIWLDEAKTSCFDFYQYFMRAEDADVRQLLYCFTWKSMAEVDEIVAEHVRVPEKRIAQHELATTVTRMVHGEIGLKKALDTSRVLYGGQNCQARDSDRMMSAQHVLDIAQNVPCTTMMKHDVIGSPLVDFIVKSHTCRSKAEVRRLIAAGGLYINHERCPIEKMQMESDDLIDGRLVLLRKGKKDHRVVHVMT